MVGVTSDQASVNRIKQYFSDLLNMPASNEAMEEIRNFAIDFVLYQYYSTGDNTVLNTVKVAEDDRMALSYTDEYGNKISYYDYISNKLSSLSQLGFYEALDSKAIDDIFMNRWYDNDMVPTASLTYGYSNDNMPLTSPNYTV